MSPEGWREVSLGEICEFRYGKSLPENARQPGPIPVFGSNGIVGHHHKAITTGPTIVVGRKGSFGEVCYSESSCWPIDTTYYVDCTATKADLRWLSYRLAALGLNQMNRAAAVPGLNRDDAYRKRLLLPPLTEQRRIAAILDKADELRSKRRAALEQLNGLTQAMFLEMFGDPATNPKEWRTLPLSECCLAVNDCPHSTPSWTEEGSVCLRTSNLTEGGWNWEDTRYVSEDDYHRRSARGYVAPGDIILSREGTVGVAAIVTPGMKVCMGQRLVQLRPATSIATADYLLSVLLYELAPERITRVMVGATSQHLNVRDLKALSVPVPPVRLQEVFSERCRSATSVASLNQRACKEHERLFRSLQHRALGGGL